MNPILPGIWKAALAGLAIWLSWPGALACLAQEPAPADSTKPAEEPGAELLFESPDALVFPQIKIDRVRFTEDGRMRIYVTLLDAERRAVPLPAIETLDVELRTQEGDQFVLRFSRGKPVIDDSDEDNPFAGTKPTATPRAKAELPAGVLIAVPAYLRSPLGTALGDAAFLARFDDSLRRAAADALKQIGKTDRGNVILYGDYPFIFVPAQGKQEKLQNIADLDLWMACKAARRKAQEEGSTEPGKPGGEVAALGREACNLLSKTEGLGAALAAMENVGFFWPDLYGVAEAPPKPYEDEVNQRAPNALRATAMRENLGSVMDEAITMLVTAGADLDQKFLLLVTDGRDGYLRSADFVATDAKKACLEMIPDLTPAERSALRKAKELAAAETRRLSQQSHCVTDVVGKYLAKEQGAFVRAAQRWLALGLAAGVRIHTVGVVSDRFRRREFELSRLQVLARESGGTYREAATPDELYQEVRNLMDELNEQVIIDLEPPLPGGTVVTVAVAAHPEGMKKDAIIESTPTTATIPVLARKGVLGLVDRGMAKLDRAVGKPWSTVIAVTIAVIAVILVLWLGVKTVKGIAKGIKKLASLGAKTA